MVNVLTPGQSVKVYADPSNKAHLIGNAILIDKLLETGNMEFWRVQFVSTGKIKEVFVNL